MKRKIAYYLVRLAAWLSPETNKMVIQHVKNYKAKQIGTAWAVTKKDIKQYKFVNGEKSTRAAKDGVVKEILAEQRQAILEKATTYIEHRTWNKHDQTIVESRLNVYVPKEADSKKE